MNAEEDEGGLLHSHAYDLFILVLTVLSLVVMVIMLLPVDDSTLGLLQFYDNLICVIFLCDFAMRMRRAHPKSAYFIGERGWLDLLGSIPSLGAAFRFSGLFRLARLSRLARLTRLMRGTGRKELAKDVLENRSRYALFITVLTTLVVLGTASVLVLQFESRSADADITNGWDSFWYSVVTITTVGYGDYAPVTVPGRIAAMSLMVAGMGIIGALASLLASVLVGGGSSGDEEPVPDANAASVAAPAVAMPSGVAPSVPVPSVAVEVELAAIRAELAALRAALEESPPRHE